LVGSFVRSFVRSFFGVVSKVLFLVVPALRAMRPLVRALWERGGVSIVTLGGYHFEDWPYDRADFDFDVRIIESKQAAQAK
jgi:hypothetical protein